MCLLIAQNKNTIVDESKIRTAAERNPDGMGYAYVDNGSIVVKKYRKVNKFIKAYNQDISKYGSKTEFLVHFRYTTHGQGEGILNVHPFKVRKGLVFAHNGVINKVRDDDKYSDTQIFNFDVLQKMPIDFLKNNHMVDMVGEFIGGSKLAFLNDKGKIQIINEDFGHWVDGIWYSNETYKERSYSCYGNYGYNYLNFNRQKEPTPAPKQVQKSIDRIYECDWCGDKCNKINTMDLTTEYDLEDVFMDMCDDCVETEDSSIYARTQDEADQDFDDWNASFGVK